MTSAQLPSIMGPLMLNKKILACDKITDFSMVPTDVGIGLNAFLISTEESAQMVAQLRDELIVEANKVMKYMATMLDMSPTYKVLFATFNCGDLSASAKTKEVLKRINKISDVLTAHTEPLPPLENKNQKRWALENARVHLEDLKITLKEAVKKKCIWACYHSSQLLADIGLDLYSFRELPQDRHVIEDYQIVAATCPNQANLAVEVQPTIYENYDVYMKTLTELLLVKFPALKKQAKAAVVVQQKQQEALLKGTNDDYIRL
jgi:hypothetical protein